jgi:hypothetical protein
MFLLSGGCEVNLVLIKRFLLFIGPIIFYYGQCNLMASEDIRLTGSLYVCII